ncbi:MAG TPA: efflux RND transporter permease subunit [Phycisphaerae bacterium]|nr:efflux RND transporter permease subunit [Phycisphaerae bacterium]
MSRSISDPFIRRPVLTMLLTLSAILFGYLAYRNLPVNDLPAVDYPVIQVNCSYPGANPETMAANVATPLEKQFMQISGLDLVTSKSTQGFTQLTLQFNLSKSIDAAATDVQTAISQAQGSLPTDLPSPPTFSKSNPNDQPILYIALVSNSVTRAKLYDYASTNVAQRIAILPGVSQVQVYGTKAAVRIKADPSALAARNMSVDDLANSVRNATVYSGAGQIDGTKRSYILDPQTQIADASGYNKLIVGSRIGSDNKMTPVFLHDVAEARDTVQDERVDMRFWIRGHEVPSATVVVAVFRQAGANAVQVAQTVKAQRDAIQNELPSSIQIIPIYDRSLTIVHSVEDVSATLYIAFVLVVIVIFAFLGRVTDTLIPVVALPLSILLTFIAMNWLGYSLDNLSLMALTLAIGFLVDDAIVFLENTVRRMEHGETALAATLHSAREISFTILSMTISLAAVFLPLVFMPGLIGRIFNEFAMTIIISIIASGIVSLTVTPLMCSRLLRDRGPGHKKTIIERTIGAIEKRVLNVYGKVLWFFLRWRFISLIIWVVCLVGTVFFFQALPKAFLPVGDSGFVWGFMIAQEGSSPEQMHKYQDAADRFLHDDPNVDTTFTMTGNGQFLASSQGLLIVFLKDQPREPIQDVSMNLMMQGNAIPGVMNFFTPQPVLQISVGAASRSTGQYSYAISGVDAQQVYEAADRLMAKFRPYPGFMSVTSDYYHSTPKIAITPLRDQASMYGVSVSRILSLIRSAYSQNYVYLIKEPTDQYQVILENSDQARMRPEDLDLLYIRSDDGQRLIPLKAVTTRTTTLGLQAVNHINQFTSVTFSFNLMPNATIGDATRFIEDTAKEVVPINIRGQFQGEAKTFRDTIPSLVLLMGLAVFVMYVILGILYESYLHPITVLSTLPVALVGGLATLFLYNVIGYILWQGHHIAHFTPAVMTLYAFIGMFMLMGIVKKNGIMIVDFAIQRVAEGQPDDQAIHDASMDRFRPIIMTTAAAVMGAIPIVLGFGADPESRRPLGLVIVGGLIFAQFITLFVTPVIYLYLEDLQEHVLDKIPFLRSTRTHKEFQKECDKCEVDVVETVPQEHAVSVNGNGDSGAPKPHSAPTHSQN